MGPIGRTLLSNSFSGGGVGGKCWDGVEGVVQSPPDVLGGSRTSSVPSGRWTEDTDVG